MTSDPTRSAGRPADRAATVDAAALSAPETIARRVPFADNPMVGQRGRRTQQRIVAAALQVFGEGGYHTSSVADLARRAGCSRVAFYQYFSSKEDVLRHLAGQVARQVGAAVEALGPLTPDAAGWTTIREWVARYADIYEHFGAVFHVFESAARETLSLKALNVQAASGNIALIRSRITSTALADHEIDAVI